MTAAKKKATKGREERQKKILKRKEMVRKNKKAMHGERPENGGEAAL